VCVEYDYTYVFNNVLQKSNTQVELSVSAESKNSDYINYSLKKKLMVLETNLNESVLFYLLDYTLIKLLSAGFKSKVGYIFKFRYIFSLRQTG